MRKYEVIEDNGGTYKEFLLQFGKVRLLDVNGNKKEDYVGKCFK